MNKLDIYIIKKFLGTFFFAILLIIVVVIIFDVSEKIDDFLDCSATMKQIVTDYYMNFIPYFINLFSHLFCFIAVIFFTSRLATNSEFIAMLASGVSFRRLLLPYFVSAFVLAALSFYLANFVIPPANKVRFDFELRYIRDLSRFWDRNVHVQTEPGVYSYVESFNAETQSGYNFTYEKTNPDGKYYRMYADFITWDTVTNNWHLDNYYIWQADGMKEKYNSGIGKEVTLPNLRPVDFAKKYVNVSTMNYFELHGFINQEKKKGNDSVLSYEVEKYRRMVDPVAMFIFTLIGLSVASRKARGGMGFHLMAGFAIAFLYIFFMRLSETFAIYGDLPPALAVWVPNVFFGLLGVYLLKIAPK